MKINKHFKFGMTVGLGWGIIIFSARTVPKYLEGAIGLERVLVDIMIISIFSVLFTALCDYLFSKFKG